MSDRAMDGLLRELARGGDGDDEAFIRRVMEGRRPRRRRGSVALAVAAAALLAVAAVAPAVRPSGADRRMNCASCHEPVARLQGDL